MRKTIVPFIFFCMVTLIGGCKTAPTDKEAETLPSATPAESVKEPDTANSAVQTAPPSDTVQKTDPATAAEPAAKSAAAQGAAPAQKPESAEKTTAQAGTRNRVPTQTLSPIRNKTAAPSSAAKPGATKQTANDTAVKNNTAKQKTGASAGKAQPQKDSAAKQPAKAATGKQTAAAGKAQPQKDSAAKQPAKAAAGKQTAAAGKAQPQKDTAAKQPAKAAAGKQTAAAGKAQPQKDSAAKQPAKAAAGKQTAAAGKTQPQKDSAAKQPAKAATDKQTAAAGKAQPQKDSAANQPAVYVAPAQITDISWMIEQADASFVSKRHKGVGKIFVTLFAKYKGELTAKDFQEASLFSPIDMWQLNAENVKNLIEINKKDKQLILKHLSAGDGEGAAALGTWFGSVTLAGQKAFEKELKVTGIGGKDVPVPANKASETGKTRKKTVSFIVPVAKAANEQQALAFPVIHSVSRDADSIEIIFSIGDSRVKNAYFYFDVPGEEYYRDSGSMIDATGKTVNGCRSFYTDGKKCQYVLRKDASNKDWFGKATRCFLVVSDVNRVASPWEERHRTISAGAAISK